jgi:hypothetical protein
MSLVAQPHVVCGCVQTDPKATPANVLASQILQLVEGQLQFVVFKEVVVRTKRFSRVA